MTTEKSDDREDSTTTVDPTEYIQDQLITMRTLLDAAEEVFEEIASTIAPGRAWWRERLAELIGYTEGVSILAEAIREAVQSIPREESK